MASTLLPLIACLIPALPPGTVPTAMGSQPGAEIIIQVRDTGLRAWNRADHAQLLYFSLPNDSAAASVVLAPNSFLDEDFPRGTLDGLRLEIVSLGAAPPATGLVGGTFELDTGVLRIPAQGTAKTPQAPWWDPPAGRRPAQAGPSSLPASLINALGAAVGGPGQQGPMHVPVITPSDGSGDGPPIPEDSPLPPV